jgi:pheromone shutdown protein TraB
MSDYLQFLYLSVQTQYVGICDFFIDALFVELCAQRVGLLVSPPTVSASGENDQQLKHDNDQSRVLSLSHRGAMMYSKIQADYAKKLNVTIGGEFREAFNSALRQQSQFWKSQTNGMYNQFQQNSLSPSIVNHDTASASHPRGNRQCAIILGDRPVSITLLRAWESLRFIGKLKLMIALIWSSIRQPSEKEIREWIESILNDRSGKNDLLTKAMEELGQTFPSLKRVIIEERDEFMVAKLQQTAEALMQSNDHGGEKVIVAVVGAGHCPGMLEKLEHKYVLESASDGRRPERVLPDLVKTKKLIATDDDLTSLVTDIVLFDYSYVMDNEFQLPEQIIQ